MAMEGEQVDKQALCVEMLVGGNVQAYVDFFYLTHRPEPTANQLPADDPGGNGVGREKLPFVKEQLEEAEVARRRGDTKAVYAAYEQLAELFGDLGDQRTAVYFWDKCAEIARLTAEAEGETKALRALGVAHEALRDVPTAIEYYDKLLCLAQDTSFEAVQRAASTHLCHAYQLMAAEANSAGDLRRALSYREKSLKAAEASGEQAAVRLAHFDLGKAHEKLQEVAHVTEAVGHYKPYLEMCEKDGDAQGQGAACFALARAYQRLEDNVSSQEYLQRFLQLSESSGQPASQAEACGALGVLYNQQGDYARAVEYFERFFVLAKSVGDRAMLDKARAYLGIARGNWLLPQYTKVVTSDVDALLAWKNRRVPFAEWPSVGAVGPAR